MAQELMHPYDRDAMVAAHLTQSLLTGMNPAALGPEGIVNTYLQVLDRVVTAKITEEIHDMYGKLGG